MANNRLSPEQIAKECESITDPRLNRLAINKLFYQQDDSELWPIRGRFNVTRRAIGRAMTFIGQTGEGESGLEYALLLDQIMGEIVNNPRNW
jgi:hypothetical protein